MQCSLYGKVPAKRDFIAIGAPREFLNAWEPWLQAAISASREALGDKWQPAFLTAPIWRFWLGADICGRSVIGALMSSLDGIGRYFPLTLFACADDNAAIPPPEFTAQEDWFDAAEAFLMGTLDRDANFEAMAAELSALPPPFQELPKAPAQGGGGDGPQPLPQALPQVLLPARGQSFSDVFSSIRLRDYAKIYAGSTFWWTIGGEGIAPIALSGKGMPDPFLFAAMLTGKFAAAPA
ncbi:MAG TPA: type VI secretion system-associated protein TagF [Xanthobacteraceae bacterium]|jgi:type VI secretion system protein ImpM|nr:type VI secretion system-associated protein TagF [Xanthobacteraceae bacterium]